MEAEQARQLAASNPSAQFQSVMEICLAHIKQASQLGKYTTVVWFGHSDSFEGKCHVMDDATRRLRELGYTAIHGISNRDATFWQFMTGRLDSKDYIHISW